MIDPDGRIGEIIQELRTIGTPEDELVTLGRARLRAELGDEQYEAWQTAASKPFRRAARVARTRRAPGEESSLIASVSNRQIRRWMRAIGRVQAGGPIEVLLEEQGDGRWTARVAGGPESAPRAKVREALDDLAEHLSELTAIEPPAIAQRLAPRVVAGGRARGPQGNTPSV